MRCGRHLECDDRATPALRKLTAPGRSRIAALWSAMNVSSEFVPTFRTLVPPRPETNSPLAAQGLQIGGSWLVDTEDGVRCRSRAGCVGYRCTRPITEDPRTDGVRNG
jgi:hypothetical protein